MGADKTITINAEVFASLKGLDKVVSQLKAGLESGTTKIDLTKGLGKNLSKLMATFKDEYSQFSNLTKNGLELGDSKKAIRSGENLLATFREIKRIVGDMESLTLIDAKRLFPDAFDKEVDSLSAKLKGIQDRYGKLKVAEIDLSKEQGALSGLERQIEELKSKVQNIPTLELDASKAVTEIADVENHIKQLRDSISGRLQLKIETKTNEIEDAQKRLAELKKKLDNPPKNFVKGEGGKADRYKGATLGEWESGKNAAKGASPQQKAAAIKILKEQEQIQQAYRETTRAIEDMQKARKAAQSDLESVTSSSDPSKTAKTIINSSGATDEEIKQAVQARDALTRAIERQQQAQANLAEAESAAKELEKTKKAAEDARAKIENLQVTIKGLSEKVDFNTIQAGFKKLGIDITPEMLKNEQSVENLRQKLSQLDGKAFEELKASLEKMGFGAEEVEKAFGGLRKGINGINSASTSIKNTADEIERLKSRVMYFFSIVNTVQLFKRAIREAFNAVKELDAAMTETATVTDFSISDMWEQLPRYTAAANELGTTTLGAYKTMTLFYQQGLDTNKVFEIGTETMKMARIAGLEYAKATDLMTAA